MELSNIYWNKLASQTILMSSLLSGFSIAVLVSLIIYNSDNRFVIYTLKAAIVAAGSFLVSLFASTRILMMTTPEFPFEVTQSDLFFPRIIIGISLLIGTISLCAFLSLLGWIKSRKIGIFSTTIGVITFLLITSMMVN